MLNKNIIKKTISSCKILLRQGRRYRYNNNNNNNVHNKLHYKNFSASTFNAPIVTGIKQLDYEIQNELKETIENIENNISENKIVDDESSLNNKQIILEKILDECISMELNIEDEELMKKITDICRYHVKNNNLYCNSIFEWFCRMDIEPKFVERDVSESIVSDVLDVIWNVSPLQPIQAGHPAHLFFLRARAMNILKTTHIYNKQLFYVSLYNYYTNRKGIVWKKLGTGKQWYVGKRTLMYEFLINDMIENNITPDRTTFDHLLNIVNDIDAAMKCWDLMVRKYHIKPEYRDYLNMLRIAGNSRKVNVSMKTYEELLSLEKQGEVVIGRDAYYHLLRLALDTRNFTRVNLFLDKMKETGLGIDLDICHLVLPSLCRIKNNFYQVEDIWNNFLHAEKDQFNSSSSALSSKVDPRDKYIEHYRNEHDVKQQTRNLRIIYNNILLSLLCNDDADKAKNLLKVEHYMNEMKYVRKLEMDSITYDRIINIYLKYNMVNEAVEMYMEADANKIEMEYLYKELYPDDDGKNNLRNKKNAMNKNKRSILKFRKEISPPSLQTKNNDAVKNSLKKCKNIKDFKKQKIALVNLFDLCLKHKPKIDDEGLIHDLILACIKIGDRTIVMNVLHKWLHFMDIKPPYKDRALYKRHQKMLKDL